MEEEDEEEVESPKERVVINIHELEEALILSRRGRKELKEKELLDRWMSMITTEYIRETVSKALEGGHYGLDFKKITILEECYDCDNDFNLRTIPMDLDRIFEEIIPPYEQSMRQIIESRVDMTGGELYISSDSKKYCIFLDYRHPTIRSIDFLPMFTLSSEIHICCYSCCFLCCVCCCLK